MTQSAHPSTSMNLAQQSAIGVFVLHALSRIMSESHTRVQRRILLAGIIL
jgi:hypothetical protein